MKSEENIALLKQELSDFKIDLGSIKELLDVNVTTAKKTDCRRVSIHFCNSHRETGSRNFLKQESRSFYPRRHHRTSWR